jgi:hypothetical protein
LRDGAQKSENVGFQVRSLHHYPLSALSRLASTEPAPTTMKSKLDWPIIRPAICIGHKRSYSPV